MVGLCHLQRAANTDFRHDYCDIHESLITSFWKDARILRTYLAIFTWGESETDLRSLVITFLCYAHTYREPEPLGAEVFWQDTRALGAQYSCMREGVMYDRHTLC
jgi:hypothetical protein